MSKTLVIGAGLAGLTAAWQTAVSGQPTTLIAKGWGATHWHTGCIDLLGQDGSPQANIEQLINRQPNHPYALVGLERIEQAVEAFKALCQASGYPLHGRIDQNWLLPSAVGAIRPTCLAPETMTAGDLTSDAPMLIVGFKQFVDFYPGLIADNLSQQNIPATHLTLNLPHLAERRTMNGVVLAQMMAQEPFQTAVINAIRPHLGQAKRVGFPAVFGNYRQAMTIKASLEQGLGRPVFEIPGLPPSIPGIRLHDILVEAIKAAGGRVNVGMEAVGADIQLSRIKRVTAVYTEAAVRQRAHRYDHFILATGGLLGGGISTSHDGRVRENIFDLPITAPNHRTEWFASDFMAPYGHPIYQSGIAVNDQLQPIDPNGRPIYDNLQAIGNTLSGCDTIREKSFDGVALVTGYTIGKK